MTVAIQLGNISSLGKWQTELEETFATHVVCKWMGNSPKVAQKHYLQVTDSHFEKAVQNPVQQASAHPRSAPPAPGKSLNKAQPLCFQGERINPARTMPTHKSAANDGILQNTKEPARLTVFSGNIPRTGISLRTTFCQDTGCVL